jgi:protein-S-isoprenylcysteine O-methyltransferase Ste14
MRKTFFLIYGVVAYLAFLASFLWAVGFVEGIAVPGVDAQPPDVPPIGRALAIDLALLGAFGISHSVMARRGFKREWTKILPPEMERSTFVLVASLLLFAICRGWQPLPGVIWQLEGALLWAVRGLSFLGWGLVLVSTFLIDHFDLFGLKQAWYAFRGRPVPAPVFREPWLYRHVRHPIYLGFLIAFWSAERMTWSRLLFGGVTTAYIAVAARLEERDLVALFGETYRAYRRRVPAVLPLKTGSGLFSAAVRRSKGGRKEA